MASAPIAECHECCGRVFRCTDARGEEVAMCEAPGCGLILMRFDTGRGDPVLTPIGGDDGLTALAEHQIKTIANVFAGRP